jgi:hypothetical protein
MIRKRLKRVVMIVHDRITIRTPHGDIKLVVTEGSVDSYAPENMNFLNFVDRGKVWQ